MAGNFPGLPPMVDPEQGLGLADMEWPPSHWFGTVPPDVQPPVETQLAPGEAPTFGVGLDGPPPGVPPVPDDIGLLPDGSPFRFPGATNEQVQPAPLQPWQTPPAAPPPAPWDDPQQGQGPLFPFEAPQVVQEAQAGLYSPQARQADEDQETARLLGLGPEGMAAEGARQDSDRAEFQRQSYLDEDTRNRQTAERNKNSWLRKSAEIEATRADRYQRLAELERTGIDNDNWMASRTTGQKIAAYITAGLGGLVAPYHGGRNAGLEMIQREIDRDVETQKANLAHRRGVIGQQLGLLAEEAQRVGNVYEAEETVRLALWQNVEKRIMAEAAGLDPRGTRAMRAAEMIQGARQKMKEEAIAAEQRSFQRKKDEFDMEIRQETLDEQRRARGAAAAEARRTQAESRARYESERGVVFNPKTGKYEPDPNAPAKPLSLDDQKKALDISKMVKGSQVTDGRGELIGTARRGIEGATKVAEATQQYEAFRADLAKLYDLIAKHKSHWGLSRKYWPSAAAAEIDSMLQPLAFKYAKALAGAGALSNDEREAAMESLPDLDGLLTSREPQARYRAAVGMADNAMEKMFGTEIEDWNDPVVKARSPTRRYQAMDQLKEKPADTAKVEDIANAAAKPLWGGTKSDPEIRAAAVLGRKQTIAELGERPGGISDKDYDRQFAQLSKELKDGDISDKEFTELMGSLTSARLLGGGNPDANEEQLQQAGRGAELRRRKQERGY